MDRRPREQDEAQDNFTLCAVMGGQLVTIFRMLGVLKTFAVLWPEPFATPLGFGSLMNF